MLALRVPCDARMSRRGANSLRSDRRTPKSPSHPVLLGKPERDCQASDRLHSKEFDFVLDLGVDSSGFDLPIPFCVVEHWKFRPEKSEDCLSAASSAATGLN